jgi:hypothetical protein
MTISFSKRLAKLEKAVASRTQGAKTIRRVVIEASVECPMLALPDPHPQSAEQDCGNACRVQHPAVRLDVPRVVIEAGTSAVAFVFEGNFDLGAIGLDLAVADNHVLFHDFRYAQLA